MSEEDARLHAGLVPGDYVVLTVTDTGEGMPPEVAARAFEPFYTTKPRGSGTGLGLATVYGIVKQAGGDIDLWSEPGSGTTATVYLPAAGRNRAGPGGHCPDRPPAEGPSSSSRTKTPFARSFSASSSATATAFSARRPERKHWRWPRSHDGEIALALTDVVMPGMSGRDFADQVTAADAELKVVFMSGYPDDVAADLGVLAPRPTTSRSLSTEPPCWRHSHACSKRRP